MAKVERGVVKPPNQELQGLAATRSHAPRAGMPATRGPNSTACGDPGGSADLTRQPSPVAPVSLPVQCRRRSHAAAAGRD